MTIETSHTDIDVERDRIHRDLITHLDAVHAEDRVRAFGDDTRAGRRALARTSTDPHVLYWLARHGVDEVAHNPACSVATLDRIARFNPTTRPEDRAAALAHPNISPLTLTEVAADPGHPAAVWVLDVIAASPNTPLSVLSGLATQGIMKVLSNPRAPRHLIEGALADPGSHRLVLENPALTDDDLQVMLGTPAESYPHDESAILAYFIAKHRNVSESTLLRLQDHRTKAVRDRARATRDARTREPVDGI